MSEYSMMARISALEANGRIYEEHKERVDSAIMNMSQDIRVIRDEIIGSNLSKLPERVTKLESLPKRIDDLEELPVRISELEKNRWISHGVIGTIGGGTGFGLAKFLAFLGVFAK